MAVDSMTDEIAGAYGGMPNGAVVIGKDGKIISREQWTNPDSLRRAIDHAWGIGSERAGQ
jgi:tRNA(Arg) A34 adenosine deaminase TadA